MSYVSAKKAESPMFNLPEVVLKPEITLKPEVTLTPSFQFYPQYSIHPQVTVENKTDISSLVVAVYVLAAVVATGFGIFLHYFKGY